LDELLIYHYNSYKFYLDFLHNQYNNVHSNEHIIASEE